MNTHTATAKSPMAISSSTLPPEVELNPIRLRRINPSFSPVKTPKPVAVPARRASSSFGEVNIVSPDPVLPTATLEFKEFSFVGPGGDIAERYAGKYLKAFQDYLVDNFGCCYIEWSGPFLILGFESHIPAEDQRPFSIAGAITFWLPAKGPGYGGSSFNSCLGEMGGQEDIEIDEDIVDLIEWCKMPLDDVILYLADNVFLDCEAVSVFWNTLIVELPKTSTEDYLTRLKSFPMGISGARCILEFHNGPLPNTPRRSRATKPNPTDLKRLVADETDYVLADGVLIERRENRRLTCSWHNWEGLDKKYPGRFGQTDVETQRLYQVNQGVVEGKPGTRVGFVCERLGDTNIALAQLDNGIKFEKGFMELNASEKVLIASKDLNYRDRYIMDSFVTGKQMLQGLGRRNLLERPRRSVAHPDIFVSRGRYDALPSDNVSYIKCRQDDRKTPVAEVLKRGEICGMFHYADLQAKHASVAQYIIYADSFDPLIEDGCTIVQSEGLEKETLLKGTMRT
ncbi:hypothetical protein F4677DRAFT_463290 [Hypoxylon crocopeplum]|nr:hypothetical protein F4677DRAFT_463290 [Hypoxylon crocopeplum]